MLGNLLSIGLDQPYRDFANMARTYGKLFRVQMGSTKVIVINSYEIAKEALVTKAKDFAGRPPHFFGAIFGRDKGLGLEIPPSHFLRGGGITLYLREFKVQIVD